MLIASGTAAPLTPDGLWTAWSLDPVVMVVVFLGLWYRRGRAVTTEDGGERRRAWAFGVALGALVVALASPLDALAEVLLSAHMVQHVLLVVVAAPLLAWCAPAGIVLRGAPPGLRRVALAARRGVRSPSRRLAAVGGPVAAWLLHVCTIWTWHAAALYEAALVHPALHLVEHAAFLGTGVLFWRVVIGTRAGSSRVPRGVGILLVFLTAMQGVLLSALLTFSERPWYPSYGSTEVWGLGPLADQHLAGVLLWIPGSVVYVTVALTLLVTGLRALDGSGSGAPRAARDQATALAREGP